MKNSPGLECRHSTKTSPIHITSSHRPLHSPKHGKGESQGSKQQQSCRSWQAAAPSELVWCLSPYLERFYVLIPGGQGKLNIAAGANCWQTKGHGMQLPELRPAPTAATRSLVWGELWDCTQRDNCTHKLQDGAITVTPKAHQGISSFRPFVFFPPL